MHELIFSPSLLPDSQETSMASTVTLSGCLSMALSLRTPTTYSLGTMLTEGSIRWRPFASFWPTRSSILRISSSSEETTNVQVSTEYMASMMSVRMHDTTSWFPFLFIPVSYSLGKRRYNIKLWKTFTDCFNCLPVAAIVDDKIFCCHGGKH